MAGPKKRTVQAAILINCPKRPLTAREGYDFLRAAQGTEELQSLAAPPRPLLRQRVQYPLNGLRQDVAHRGQKVRLLGRKGLVVGKPARYDRAGIAIANYPFDLVAQPIRLYASYLGTLH